MNYTCESVNNLQTGEPFVFDVDESRLATFEHNKGVLKRLIEEGDKKAPFKLSCLVRNFEFSFFSAYEDLLNIMFDNGYTPELATKILTDFGLSDESVVSILADPNFEESVGEWFESITCDDDRATRTLEVVYRSVKNFLEKGRFLRTLP